MATTSIGAPGVVFPDATVQASAAAPNVITTIYTSPASWTKPATLKGVRVTVVAGGGSGAQMPVTNLYTGGNGAAGIGFFSAPSIPGPVTVTIGAGGAPSAGTTGSSAPPGNAGNTSSFGSLISATGGGGAINTPAAAAGAGGSITPSSTVIGINGNEGSFFAAQNAAATSNAYTAGAVGFGLGMGGASATTGGMGYKPFIGYGGGGASIIASNPASGRSTGAGGPGVIIVEEFY